MTFRRLFVFTALVMLLVALTTRGQIDSVLAQLSNSAAESFAGGISGNGRFIVFESRGDLATENPRNADNNVEIFLFDYAQRRIFQITNTKSVLFNPAGAATFDNTRVEIVNTRPVISNDGRWIAFSSNATTSTPALPDNTNPGSFDGNAFTSPTPTPSPTPSPSPSPSPTATPTPALNPLASDGNLEMWLYEIPAYVPVADLSAGDELPRTELAGGSFTRVTNTPPSQLPRPGTSTTGSFVADDNHDASISDDGSVIAFVSTRDLVPSIGNSLAANEDNDEIFTYVRTAGTFGQVTKTPRGPISNPIYNKNPTISGNGLRVAFASTGDNPIVGMTGGSNPATSRNEEIFFSDLDAAGEATGTRRQVTTTTPTNPGDAVNLLDLGRRMSRDGRYIAFDSFADLASATPGANSAAFALFLYDATTNSFRQIGPRSDADTAALGGDIAHYPGFTDTDASGTPSTLVLTTRLNIRADGTIPTTAADGLNPNEVRPAQIYSYPISATGTAATFSRLANFPEPNSFLASTQLLPSNALQRMTFNLALTELGTGNPDAQSEVFYFLRPTADALSPVTISLATGASRLPITLATPSPSPTPTATATPTPTPTPTPSPTPTGSPSPTPTPMPTPTPVTPPAVFGVAPGMLAVLDYQSGSDRPVVARTGVGSLMRSPTLPIELSGVSMTINGAACGLKSVGQRRIEFVVPPGLAAVAAGTTYPLVINNNGLVLKSTIVLVPARPDIFTTSLTPGPGGRARLFNVTNTVFTSEPFVIRTIRRRGNMLVPSVIRVFITGVQGRSAAEISVRIGGVTIVARNNPSLFEPGVQVFDFDLPATLEAAGDQPVVVTVTVGMTTFTSRLDDTAPRVSIL